MAPKAPVPVDPAEAIGAILAAATDAEGAAAKAAALEPLVASLADPAAHDAIVAEGAGLLAAVASVFSDRKSVV